MVATTAFGMGVDVPDIRLVLHFNLPLNVIDYYQQIGRAGRDGNPAHAVLLYAKEDLDLNRHILDHGGYAPKLEKWLHCRLDEMANVAANLPPTATAAPTASGHGGNSHEDSED